MKAGDRIARLLGGALLAGAVGVVVLGSIAARAASTTFIAMRRRDDQLYLLADDPSLSAPGPSTQLTLLVSSDEGLAWSTYATVPWGGVALGAVEKDLLIIGANGLVVRLR